MPAPGLFHLLPLLPAVCPDQLLADPAGQSPPPGSVLVIGQIAAGVDVCVWPPCLLRGIYLFLPVLFVPHWETGATEWTPVCVAGWQGAVAT